MMGRSACVSSLLKRRYRSFCRRSGRFHVEEPRQGGLLDLSVDGFRSWLAGFMQRWPLLSRLWIANSGSWQCLSRGWIKINLMAPRSWSSTVPVVSGTRARRVVCDSTRTCRRQKFLRVLVATRMWLLRAAVLAGVPFYSAWYDCLLVASPQHHRLRNGRSCAAGQATHIPGLGNRLPDEFSRMCTLVPVNSQAFGDGSPPPSGVLKVVRTVSPELPMLGKLKLPNCRHGWAHQLHYSWWSNELRYDYDGTIFFLNCRARASMTRGGRGGRLTSDQKIDP